MALSLELTIIPITSILFLKRFPGCVNLFVLLFFFATPCLVQPCMELTPIKKIINRINCLHKRALRTINDDSTYSFVSLLERDNSFSVHDCNIQHAVMEM